jgi:hypothetical protein
MPPTAPPDRCIPLVQYAALHGVSYQTAYRWVRHGRLVAALGADPGRVWQLRLCGYPSVDRWTEDVARMAALVDAPRGSARHCTP